MARYKLLRRVGRTLHLYRRISTRPLLGRTSNANTLLLSVGLLPAWSTGEQWEQEEEYPARFTARRLVDPLPLAPEERGGPDFTDEDALIPGAGSPQTSIALGQAVPAHTEDDQDEEFPALPRSDDPAASLALASRAVPGQPRSGTDQVPVATGAPARESMLSPRSAAQDSVPNAADPVRRRDATPPRAFVAAEAPRDTPARGVAQAPASMAGQPSMRRDEPLAPAEETSTAPGLHALDPLQSLRGQQVAGTFDAQATADLTGSGGLEMPLTSALPAQALASGPETLPATRTITAGTSEPDLAVEAAQRTMTEQSQSHAPNSRESAAGTQAGQQAPAQPPSSRSMSTGAATQADRLPWVGTSPDLPGPLTPTTGPRGRDTGPATHQVQGGREPGAMTTTSPSGGAREPHPSPSGDEGATTSPATLTTSYQNDSMVVRDVHSTPTIATPQSAQPDVAGMAPTTRPQPEATAAAEGQDVVILGPDDTAELEAPVTPAVRFESHAPASTPLPATQPFEAEATLPDLQTQIEQGSAVQRPAPATLPSSDTPVPTSMSQEEHSHSRSGDTGASQPGMPATTAAAAISVPGIAGTGVGRTGTNSAPEARIMPQEPGTGPVQLTTEAMASVSPDPLSANAALPGATTDLAVPLPSALNPPTVPGTPLAAEAEPVFMSPTLTIDVRPVAGLDADSSVASTSAGLLTAPEMGQVSVDRERTVAGVAPSSVEVHNRQPASAGEESGTTVPATPTAQQQDVSTVLHAVQGTTAAGEHPVSPETARVSGSEPTAPARTARSAEGTTVQPQPDAVVPVILPQPEIIPPAEYRGVTGASAGDGSASTSHILPPGLRQTPAIEQESPPERQPLATTDEAVHGPARQTERRPLVQQINPEVAALPATHGAAGASREQPVAEPARADGPEPASQALTAAVGNNPSGIVGSGVDPAGATGAPAVSVTAQEPGPRPVQVTSEDVTGVSPDPLSALAASPGATPDWAVPPPSALDAPTVAGTLAATGGGPVLTFPSQPAAAQPVAGAEAGPTVTREIEIPSAVLDKGHVHGSGEPSAKTAAPSSGDVQDRQVTPSSSEADSQTASSLLPPDLAPAPTIGDVAATDAGKAPAIGETAQEPGAGPVHMDSAGVAGVSPDLLSAIAPSPVATSDLAVPPSTALNAPTTSGTLAVAEGGPVFISPSHTAGTLPGAGDGAGPMVARMSNGDAAAPTTNQLQSSVAPGTATDFSPQGDVYDRQTASSGAAPTRDRPALSSAPRHGSPGAPDAVGDQGKEGVGDLSTATADVLPDGYTPAQVALGQVGSAEPISLAVTPPATPLEPAGMHPLPGDRSEMGAPGTAWQSAVEEVDIPGGASAAVPAFEVIEERMPSSRSAAVPAPGPGNVVSADSLLESQDLAPEVPVTEGPAPAVPAEHNAAAPPSPSIEAAAQRVATDVVRLPEHEIAPPSAPGRSRSETAVTGGHVVHEFKGPRGPRPASRQRPGQGADSEQVSADPPLLSTPAVDLSPQAWAERIKRWAAEQAAAAATHKAAVPEAAASIAPTDASPTSRSAQPATANIAPGIQVQPEDSYVPASPSQVIPRGDEILSTQVDSVPAPDPGSALRSTQSGQLVGEPYSQAPADQDAVRRETPAPATPETPAARVQNSAIPVPAPAVMQAGSALKPRPGTTTAPSDRSVGSALSTRTLAPDTPRGALQPRFVAPMSRTRTSDGVPVEGLAEASVQAGVGRTPDDTTPALQAMTPISLSDTPRQFLQTMTGVDAQTIPLVQAPADMPMPGADAMAVGEVVVLARPGSLETPESLGLLAHEMTHVARRRQPRFIPPVARDPGRPPTGAPSMPADPVAPEGLDEEGLARQVEARVMTIARGQAMRTGVPGAAELARGHAVADLTAGFGGNEHVASRR